MEATNATSTISANGSNRQEMFDKPLMQFALPSLRVVIRPLQEEDSLALEWHGGEDLRNWYREQWEHHQAGERLVLVADLNGFPIGQAALLWHGKPTHPHIPDIQSLRVFAAFRGLRIGTYLMEACENAVRERGYSQVSLAVALDNPRARKLYERHGYRTTGDTYDDEWHYEDANGELVRQIDQVVDMVKNLES
jgi:ribosomal protein S18 acetylase RimI-like enzyme